jgi:hypothetical protein
VKVVKVITSYTLSLVFMLCLAFMAQTVAAGGPSSATIGAAETAENKQGEPWPDSMTPPAIVFSGLSTGVTGTERKSEAIEPLYITRRGLPRERLSRSNGAWAINGSSALCSRTGHLSKPYTICFQNRARK